MIFQIEPYELKILELIGASARELGFPAYVIGGYVRDRILNRGDAKDLDVVCLGSGIKLAEHLASKLRPIPRVTVYERFGTAMLKHRELEIEFVGARKESYRPDSRKPTVEEGTLEDDQNRRDFTINALAISLNKDDFGHLIDPFNGMAHLEQKKIITPLAPESTFSDDPLRMLRAIRFATQLNFEIEENTFEGIQESAYRLKIISKERVHTELNKILLAPKPSIGFELLRTSGLLSHILPEMIDLCGVDYVDGKGHKDNFYHTLEVLDNVASESNDLWLRWAALLHDIAKPPTKRFDEKVGWTFHGHEVVGVHMTAKIFKRLKLPLDHKLKFVQKLVRMHLRPISLTKDNVTDSAIRRLLFDAGDDLDQLLILCQADITSKNEKKKQRYLANYKMVRQKLIEVEEKDKIRNWQPPVSGELIMETFGIKPSQTVGTIKDSIREAILDGDIANDYEAAFQFMLEKAKTLGLSQVS